MYNFLDRETKCNSLKVEPLFEADEGDDFKDEDPSDTKSGANEGQQSIIEDHDKAPRGLTEEEEAVYRELERQFLSS